MSNINKEVVMKETIANIILIGCGPHANRIYLPILKQLEQEGKANLCLIVELESKKEEVFNRLEKFSIAPELLFIESFKNSLPTDLEDYLTDYIESNNINGVIIATEPLVHKPYASFMLDAGINILMDKPITTRENVVTCIDSAKLILADYEYLLERYNSSCGNNVFIVNTQRRFHPGFRFAINLIKEVSNITNCPITSIQAYHCDGQWRFPNEIVSQKYHPYCTGYGKASHSGYHIFDIINCLYSSSISNMKCADSMEVVSSFVQPDGFIKQVGEEDYKNILPEIDNGNTNIWPTENEIKDFSNYGELDLSSIITLKKENINVANFSINLIHNGFSMRTWVQPGTDLYKGNGRVKHESYNIQQGPFQNVQIHSYQSNDNHDGMTCLDGDLGGNNHFDIIVYRNPLIASTKKSMEFYNINDILKQMEQGTTKEVLTESVKYKVVRDFISYINGTLSREDIKSHLDEHLFSVQIMSSIYQSHIKRTQSEDCIVKTKIFE